MPIIIDNDLRTMSIPSDLTLLGVESDDDVKKIEFQMPKTYCGFDLSQFEVRVNFMNAHGDGDLYIADDVTVSGDNLTFTWLVGRSACMYKGNTQFIVCLKKFNSEDVVVQEFNTTVYSLPVLEGLETTEVVVQQNPDIIEHILTLIEEAGILNPDDYYNKEEVDALLPTELPNPEPLTINGTSYDGSEPVDMTITVESNVIRNITGKMIHVVDAVPGVVNDLKLYDSESQPIASAEIAVANKNLFRIDLIDNQVISKGITFIKNQDGSISATGTSTDSNAQTTCEIDKNCFITNNVYTLSANKVLGSMVVRLDFTFTDDSTLTVNALNEQKSFILSKEVSSCIASVTVPNTNTYVNEKVYPQLELNDYATSFVINEYEAITFDGTEMPELPASISNLWCNDDSVASMDLKYTANIVMTSINSYMDENVKSNQPTGQLTSQWDGVYTVSLGME